MQDDDIETLQIRHEDQGVTIKPIPDTLVVNVEDVTEVFIEFGQKVPIPWHLLRGLSHCLL